MKLLKYFMFTLSIFLFSACGTTPTIDPRAEFDLWDYLTSNRNYDVVYQRYHNEAPDGTISERDIYNGNQYLRNHNDGTTTQILTNDRTIMMIDPDGVETNIIRYVYLGDKRVFQSPFIQLCSFERFYESYQTHGSQFYNVIQISCSSRSGVYQEFYYGYDEGLVAFYQDNGGIIDESIKIEDRAI